jgi:hypothetical protein
VLGCVVGWQQVPVREEVAQIGTAAGQAGLEPGWAGLEPGWAGMEPGQAELVPASAWARASLPAASAGLAVPVQ